MNNINKIIIPILITVSICLVIPLNVYSATSTQKIGDINGDGIIDSRDTLKILKHIAASSIPKISNKHSDWILSGTNFKVGDINEDGFIDSRDTLKELEYIAASTIPEIATKHPEWKNNMNREENGIELNETSVTISIGQVYKIIPTKIPTNIENNTIKWSSSDTTIATVDGIGIVTGKKAGISIITAKTSNNVTKTCKVTVIDNNNSTPTNNKEIKVTSISLTPTIQTIKKGSNLTLKTTIFPTNATNKTITWNTNNMSVATVDTKGNVRAVKAGIAVITATTNGKTAQCTIKVVEDTNSSEVVVATQGKALNKKAGFSKESYSGLKYYKSIPDNPTENMPFIIFLHGDGEQNNFSKLGKLPIVEYVKSKQAYKAGKFVFIAPLRTSSHWASGNTLKNLMKLIEKTASDYKVDKKRIILTGMSSGGNGTWNIACKYQNYFAAIVPMSAKTAGASASKLRNLPIWGICGNKTSDEKERNRQMRKLIKEIDKKNGVKITKFESFEKERHGTIQKYYKRQELFKWMLAQRRK